MRTEPVADRLTPEALQRLADEDLMTLVERRDADAFAVLYDRHGGAAYSLAHRIVGDPAIAEDVTQEAFISVWRSGARFDAARGSVRSWTLGIVRNRAIDALRRASGSAPKLDLDDDAVLESQTAGELTDSEAIRRETSRQVRGALQRPAPGAVRGDRARLLRRLHPLARSREMLGMPLGTVKGRMRLGLEKIRITLAERMGIEGPSEVLP